MQFLFHRKKNCLGRQQEKCQKGCNGYLPAVAILLVIALHMIFVTVHVGVRNIMFEFVDVCEFISEQEF